jgi:hypothetical protein
MGDCRAPVADMPHRVTRVPEVPASWSGRAGCAAREAEAARAVLGQVARSAAPALASMNLPAVAFPGD